MLLSNLWDLEPAGTAIVTDFIARSKLVTCKVIVAAYDVVKKVQLAECMLVLVSSLFG